MLSRERSKISHARVYCALGRKSGVGAIPRFELRSSRICGRTDGNHVVLFHAPHGNMGPCIHEVDITEV